MMKTVPVNVSTDDAATYAVTRLEQQRAEMMQQWGAPGLGAGLGDGGVTLGKNGSSLQQPPQVGKTKKGLTDHPSIHSSTAFVHTSSTYNTRLARPYPHSRTPSAGRRSRARASRCSTSRT